MRKQIAATLLITMMGLGGVQAQTLDGMMASLPMGKISDLAGVDPAAFLGRVQGLIHNGNTRDIAALGKQAAKVALQVEELQISFMQTSICNSNTIPAQYAREVQLGCELLKAQSTLNQLKQQMLAKVAP
jgi:hypothetical protein